jgi:hypothetical protein
MVTSLRPGDSLWTIGSLTLPASVVVCREECGSYNSEVSGAKVSWWPAEDGLECWPGRCCLELQSAWRWRVLHLCVSQCVSEWFAATVKG